MLSPLLTTVVCGDQNLPLHTIECNQTVISGSGIDPGHLVGAAEIAERAGLRQRQTVHLWRNRYPDFPAPIADLHQGLIWSWPEVEAWLRVTGRLGSESE